METLVIVFTIMFVSLYSFVSAKAGQIYVPMVTKGECEFYCTVENQPPTTPSPIPPECEYGCPETPTVTPIPVQPTPVVTPVPNSGLVLSEQQSKFGHNFGKITNTSNRLWSYGLTGYGKDDLWLSDFTLQPGQSSCYTYRGKIESQPIRTYPNQDVTNHSDYGFTYSNVHVDEHNLYVTVTNNGERNQWGWGVIIALYDDNGLWNCLGYASYNGLESQETLNAGQSFDVVLPLYNNNEYHPITTYTVQFGD